MAEFPEMIAPAASGSTKLPMSGGGSGRTKIRLACKGITFVHIPGLEIPSKAKSAWPSLSTSSGSQANAYEGGGAGWT
jgi:hypothetical protein